MSAKATAKGHAAKHVTAKKHAAASKHRPNHHKKPATSKATGHKVTAKAKHPAHAKAVGFAVGDLLPVCGFEAVAQSLRLAGQFVHDDEVAWLWELRGSPAAGVPVGDALAAAALFGLAGYRPAAQELPGPRRHGRVDEHGDAEDFAWMLGMRPVLSRTGVHHLEVALDESVQQVFGHGLILRIDVPGPHAVLATADGWWSWGELHSPWPCRIEEAWAVSWS